MQSFRLSELLSFNFYLLSDLWKSLVLSIMGKNKKGRNKLKQNTVTEGALPKTPTHNYPSISKLTLWGSATLLAALAIILYGGSYNHDFAYMINDTGR